MEFLLLCAQGFAAHLCCIRKKNRKKQNALIVFAPGRFAAPRVQNLETFVVRTFLDSEIWEGLWRVLLEENFVVRTFSIENIFI